MIYLFTRHKEIPQPANPSDEALPPVVVQLPIYNERHVVDRVVDSISRLDYPRDKLFVQLLDDSDDDTVQCAAAAAERARANGLRIEHMQRETRTHYKAGALAYGLARTNAPFVTVFDADFAPRPDFLRKVMPHFVADERLGLLQTRWSHLNAEFSLMTRAQALAIDAHFAVEQVARHRSGLLINFAGTGGVWRRVCIDESGGWTGETLSEDIDLSYRAQLAGWRALYLPDIDAPAEIPPLMMGFKRQQNRWATGFSQCFLKLSKRVLASELSLWQKMEAIIHLGGHFAHPLMVLVLLLFFPLMVTGRLDKLPLAGLSIGMLGMPLEILLSQKRLYSDWPRRFLLLPLLIALGIGTSLSNTFAVFRAFSRRVQVFERTPKFNGHGDSAGAGWGRSYMLSVDFITWLELLLAIYAICMMFLSIRYAPELTPFTILYVLGYGYVSGMSLYQSILAQQHRTERQRAWMGF